MVLIHHGLLPGGWVGVDIFFVLSGFLITRILRREKTHADFWKSFYVKRATRILPPFLALALIAFVMAGQFKPIYLGYLFFASNLVQLSPAALPVLGALWSLAIEEHFYFLWPLAVRRLSRNALLKLSLIIVALSPLLRIVGTLVFRQLWGGHHDWDNPIFLLTPFRIDGLAAGAALALLLEDGRCPALLRRWSGPASVAAAGLFFGLEGVFKSFRRTTDSVAFNGFGYSLIVASAFCLVSFLVTNPEARLTKLLSSKVLVFVGTVSYGIYLYQELVMYTVRSMIGLKVPLKYVLLPDVAALLAVATVSFYFLEKPIIKQGRIWLAKSQSRVGQGVNATEKASHFTAKAS